MGNRLSITLSRVKMFQTQIRDLWVIIERYHWSFSHYLDIRQKMLENPTHRSLPKWAKENLRGYDTALFDAIERKHIFSYLVDGKRVTTSSPEWADAIGKLSEMEEAGSFDPKSGKHVWREDNSKVWN